MEVSRQGHVKKLVHELEVVSPLAALSTGIGLKDCRSCHMAERFAHFCCLSRAGPGPRALLAGPRAPAHCHPVPALLFSLCYHARLKL